MGGGIDLTNLSNLGKRLKQERELICDSLLKDGEISFAKNFCDGSHVKFKRVLKE